MDRRNYLDKFYEINEITGNYQVEIAVDRYRDIFNDIDNAPFVKKDINHGVKDFLYDSSTDIPFRYKVDVCFKILAEKRDESMEKLVAEGFRTYCSFFIHADKKKLKTAYFRVLKYGIASFILLFAGFFLKERLPDILMSNVLLEGLTIGGWVFLWQAILFFTDDRKGLSTEIRILKRVLSSRIFFRYKES